MKIEPLDLLLKKIMAQYNRNPESWKVLIDQKGNVIVLGAEANYHLKLIHVNPMKFVGVGAQIPETNRLQQLTSGTYSYGFRALTPKDTNHLLGAMGQEEYPPSQILHDVLNRTPLSLNEIQKSKETTILAGPLLAHSDLGRISSSQRELERRLSLEAEKLFRRKYPFRSSMYI
ncbi:MAG: hypothetical protein ACFFB3_17375 [Candidatus Hodarchaeota archaeon]